MILISWDIQADPMGCWRGQSCVSCWDRNPELLMFTDVFRVQDGPTPSSDIYTSLLNVGGLSTHQSGVVTAVLVFCLICGQKRATKLWTSCFFLAKRHFKTPYTLGTVSFLAKLNKCQTRKPQDPTTALGSAVTCPHRWAPTEIFTTRAECAEQDEKAEISKPPRNLLKPEEWNF